MNIVIISHGHPVFSKGGAEFSAYYLWQGINKKQAHEAWFLGRAEAQMMHSFSDIAAVGERDYLISGDATMDLVATTNLGSDCDLAQLLRNAEPDIVHFHHYVHVGIETIRLVKNVCPAAKIFITLHEYIAICMNNGQMITTDGRLCYRSSPRDCHRCFPHLKPEDHFLREQYTKSFFSLVDQFISPSAFLRDRYIEWGIEADKIKVIENGLPEDEKLPPRQLRGDEARGRFAYFGQINPYKGVDLILEALLNLPRSIRKVVRLDIFGSALRNQEQSYQDEIQRLLEKLNGTVRLHGAYEPQEMGQLLKDIDWVIMGSIWWENSPLVIQEAYKYGRPVIAPDIGGMAEKVKAGSGGLNYRARDSVSLASVLRRVVDEPELFESVQQTIPAYPKIDDIVEQHIELYKGSD